MLLHYSLQPISVHDQPLHFTWNSVTGELGGDDAEQVRALCLAAARAGHVVSHPYPTEYRIQDPLHRLSEMAVVLGQYWKPEGELQKAYPAAGLFTQCDNTY